MENSDTHYFAAFDLGATSGRAVLGKFEDGQFSMEEVYRFPNGIMELNGKYFWNIYDIFSNVRKALTMIAKRGIELSSIGIDSWGVDFGYIAGDGTLLGLPRAYRDPYTSGIPSEVFKIIPRDELYDITGIQILDFNSVFQLYAAKNEKSSALEYAGKILFIPDLLLYFLTGKMVCEYTEASTSQLIDPRTRDFDRSVLSRLGIDSSILLPPVQPGTVAGKLDNRIAAETGLRPGIPVVAVAEHDTASAVVAVPASDPGFAYLSSGTWSLMGIESEKPIISADSCKMNFTNEGGIEGTVRFLKNITGMWLLEQCRKVWEKEGSTYDYPAMEKMAQNAYQGRTVPVINPDDPSLANPENMVSAICSLVAAGGYDLPANDGEMISIIYHSLVKRYAEVFGMLRDFAGFPLKKLHVIGGGSANAYMNRLTAKALGVPVAAGPKEASAIGNIMIQAKASGLFRDRWEIRRAVAGSCNMEIFNP
ncbi:MAG: rhamnulokinase [Bacteroidales bacterium]|nr:rhamnulokinase [Bacteroidales bacterium]